MSENTEASTRRLGRLRAVMAEQGLAAFPVRETSDIAWLTAFDGVFDEEEAHVLLVQADAAILHTDSRYAEACRAAAEGGPVAVDATPANQGKWVVDLLAGLPQWAGVPLRFGIQDTICLREYRQLENAVAASKAALAIEETADVVVGLRAVKDDLEIARMRAAQAITDAAFTHIIGFIQAGMSERQVQIELDDFMRRQGATALAFPTIVATGAHAANPHAQPDETIIRSGDAIVMDFGAKKDGYCSDMTRTVFVGQPDERQCRAFETLRRANEGAESLLRPGVIGAEAHKFAEETLGEGGFAGKMGHALGHGVGLDIHESPVLAPRTEDSLEVGNVVTVEPGIYLPGEFGMRLEDFGVITANGYAVLTQSTHDMVII